MRSAVPEQHPFAPGRTPSREQLIAYAQGRLRPQEEFEVETHLVQDRLAADAVEGLSLPGALEGLESLHRHRPGRKWPWRSPRATAALGLAFLICAWWSGTLPHGDEAMPSDESSQVTQDVDRIWHEGTMPAHAPSMIEMEGTAIDEATTRKIVRRAPLLREETTAEREAITTHLRPVTVKPPLNEIEKRPVPGHRSPPVRHNRQLHYLHDLKILHPKEMYGVQDPFSLLTGTPAGGASREPWDHHQHQEYLPFMEHALLHFRKGAHKQCLAELELLLEQHPDDVNAIFYSGLCDHAMGRYDRALRFFSQAMSHAIDVFLEEATWYHALSLEGAGRDDEAAVQFEKIRAKGGFYAEKAATRTGW
jgi:tetratricopeptide (TPR) repeat protein